MIGSDRARSSAGVCEACGRRAGERPRLYLPGVSLCSHCLPRVTAALGGVFLLLAAVAFAAWLALH
jgi:hypothetical protein